MSFLKYRNDWGSDEYYLNNRRVKNLQVVEIGGEQFNVASRTVEVEYFDHGVRGYGRSTHFFITVYVQGIEFERDLNTLCGTHNVRAIVYEAQGKKI